MNSGIAFAICILCIALNVAAFRLGGIRNAIKYIRDPQHKSIEKGVVLFSGIGIIVGIIFAILINTAHAAEPEQEELNWFKYGEIFIGVDFPIDGTSPQCVKDGPDNKTTSNGGFRANVIQYGRFDLNAKYQHHSCAFNVDRNTYDQVGVEASYRLW